MKKLFTLIIMLAATMAMSAKISETEHLTFDGIPIDGNCTEFAGKMQGKGYKLDFEASRGLDRNAHAFTGSYHGYKSPLIITHFDGDTKTVFDVGVFYLDLPANIAAQLTEAMLKVVQGDYPGCRLETESGYDGTSITVYNKKDEMTGWISIKTFGDRNGKYTVAVMFHDIINNYKYKK